MRDDPRYHPHSPPPDSVSSTHQAPTEDDLFSDVVRRASFDSQEPHDHCRISPPFVDDANKLTPYSCSVSPNGKLYLQKNQRSNDRPPVMRSTVNTSFFSDQNPEISEKESSSEEKRPVTAIYPSTPMDSKRPSCSSTHSTDISAATSVSSSLPSHGSWYEEEKVFPLKKRRISLERFISTQESSTVLDKQNENRRIAKMWASSGIETIYGKERDYDEVEINSDQAIEENLMMRCTKVNGAGWRCSKRRIEEPSSRKHHFNLKRMDNSLRSGFGGRYRLSNASKTRKDFRACKKRKRVIISSILDRTVPVHATIDYSEHNVHTS
ncbi:hypothetical protein SADUNF_Sadunf06G0151300 [Salix dunnii]|uniref:WRC domain-containing protein n=1 Tax=Salix dunnii TaxID=1413687 RepID=A0A835K1Y7_9ROSI|nr:hypothetical protein SADUNF_Sadunf06G0151300 [Salix dunnii]